MGGSPTSSSLLCACSLAFYYYFSLMSLLQIARAQNGTTPASEVSALNSVFSQWRIPTRLNPWNISGEPCSGTAIDNSTSIDSTSYNPGIKCSCDGTVCHITQLKVYALDVEGGIPDELWSLTSLTNLNLGQNYLTGRLSSSIADLTQMQYLSFGINALSGEVPKELGNLTNLLSLSFSSNDFSGSLPSELGNLTNLQQLWGSDNGLTGSIPEFIGNWSKLQVLRLQGNSFEGQIPSTFSNLILLTDLVLRNNNISGSILSNIGDFQSLALLFLGNNNFNGMLPALKSTSLLNIDVSYNEFSGSFPSWINEQGLELNLVANNFTIESANNSVLHSGLRCLQRNFPCSRNSPIYSDFAIKCGGPEFTSSKIVFETENETLGPASYYVTSTNRWAVSTAGLFLDNTDTPYVSSSSRQFTVSLGSQSSGYETARISPGSLRYYGLGLQNGNYNVTLHFAEIALLDATRAPGWRSLGRRVFDIYIQGNRVLKDFDIKKEAGGVSFQPVQIDFTAQVSENYLEIHLFWAGKGTCCIPVLGTYGPLISAISAVPDFIPTVSNNPPTSKKSNKTSLIVGIVAPVGVGTLNDGRVIAVKQLSVASHQGKSQFVAEIATISAVRQRNLVKFGYLAPEYAMRGRLTEKADVFGFGVVALEIVSGRPNSDSSLEEEKIYLLEWAWRLHENDNEVGLVDANLLEFDEEEVKRVIGVALLCTQTSPQLRPSMSRAVAMLSGDIEVSAVTTRPGYLIDWKFNDTTSFMTTDTPRSENEYNQFSSSSATMVGDLGHSPINAVHRVQEIIGEGRSRD
ncbi:hypothetical protein Vadar_017095 [Vaccinium darrowii]|uniref:Uncharacterized protein n=1 Tax=Vaccinium darrowii TaxID=229202 RepID=A0ACB7Z6U9_9ERIC|nr:hypothetical protein Vadar_017095 [Vaccinium darrowii]